MYWEEDIFVRPIQLWVKKYCRNEDFPWYNMTIMDQVSFYEYGYLEVCVMLQLYEGHFLLVSKMLVWINWNFDIT